MYRKLFKMAFSGLMLLFSEKILFIQNCFLRRLKSKLMILFYRILILQGHISLGGHLSLLAPKYLKSLSLRIILNLSRAEPALVT